jgi:hypothetical protein
MHRHTSCPALQTTQLSTVPLALGQNLALIPMSQRLLRLQQKSMDQGQEALSLLNQVLDQQLQLLQLILR